MFKTAIFKLHNPSKRKQALLQKAFKNYHLLYDRLLVVLYNQQNEFYSALTQTHNNGDKEYVNKAAKYIN